MWSFSHRSVLSAASSSTSLLDGLASAALVALSVTMLNAAAHFSASLGGPRENALRLLDATRDGDGVKIFIGAENNLFASTGCSLVIAPYRNNDRSIIGAIGVLGPRHMNYARIIPMVDYTSKAIDRVLGR